MKVKQEDNEATKGKSKAKSGGLFFAGALVGVIIGATTTYKVTAQPYQNIVADQAVSNVMSDTHNAIRLREEHETEIAKRIEMNLPNNVLMLSSVYPDHRMTPSALRNIRFYYQKNNIPIPANIGPILNAVPK